MTDEKLTPPTSEELDGWERLEKAAREMGDKPNWRADWDDNGAYYIEPIRACIANADEGGIEGARVKLLVVIRNAAPRLFAAARENAELRAEVERLEVQVESEKAQKECYQQRAESAEQQAEALAGALEQTLKSAVPNQRDHPTMCAAWKVGSAALSAYRAAQKGASNE